MIAAKFISFTASMVSGAKRGRTMGTPTINLELSEVPKELSYGIYACLVRLDSQEQQFPAVMHYGPRPVFQDSISCEVHVIDHMIESPPSSVHVEMHDRIRDVSDFSSRELLEAQIQSDIRAARGFLKRS